ncbi:MAG TPA: precorrin-6A synthase (deacetylating) [Propionibacteriaceae bacterium]|nr:precorrin-6A synthase (deacetylating) [Propionibacteriaceae bacterium]
MTLRALVIGIGTGNPGHVTREAVAALNAVDVFLVTDKGAGKQDLASLRTEICRQLINHDHYRIVEVPDPGRGPDRDRDGTQYRNAVAAWHAQRARRYAEIITAEVGADGTIGFLVWGDPSLYDSTIRIVESIRDDAGVDLELTVIPGISSLSLLAARHQISLNRIGQPVHVTTGRRLLQEFSPELGDVAVMLDGGLTCAELVDRYPNLIIFWGAQLGLNDEALVAGPLTTVIDQIRDTRSALRAHRGWVMDIYLLRPGG